MNLIHHIDHSARTALTAPRMPWQRMDMNFRRSKSEPTRTTEPATPALESPSVDDGPAAKATRHALTLSPLRRATVDQVIDLVHDGSATDRLRHGRGLVSATD